MGLLAGLANLSPQTVPEIRPDTPHYEAVGRFVTSYANAESTVHLLARQLSGMSDEKARIVFGGMRLADLIDITRHFMRIDNTPETKRTEIDSYLTQLNLISKKRHSIVHRSTVFFADKLSVSNIATSKNISSAEFEIFDIRELADMQMDCMRINVGLADIVEPREAYSAVALALNLQKDSPWQYRPPAPKTPNLKPRAKSPKRPPQPPASRALRRREAMKKREKS